MQEGQRNRGESLRRRLPAAANRVKEMADDVLGAAGDAVIGVVVCDDLFSNIDLALRRPLIPLQ